MAIWSLDRLRSQLGRDIFVVVAIYLDPYGVSNRALKVRGLSTSYLVDDDRHMAGYIEGTADWDSAQAILLIRYYVERIGARHSG